MELIDFNAYQQNQRMYGGTAGRKMGITYRVVSETRYKVEIIHG